MKPWALLVNLTSPPASLKKNSRKRAHFSTILRLF
jgi:hypothetical protein